VYFLGELLLDSRTPILAAAGHCSTGARREVYRSGAPLSDLQLDIEKGAALTLAKWSPSPWSGVSRRSVSARTAMLVPPVG
jgi:hypothetical protein